VRFPEARRCWADHHTRLALTDISGIGAGSLHNVHFQDELIDGCMNFDFKLREGVVTKSMPLR